MKMKFSKTILSIFFIIGFICSLHAAKLRFRSGNILAAELSSATPSINNFNKDAFPNLPEQKVCAVITIQLDKSRKISIFDYTLNAPGGDYPCVAFAKNSDFEYGVEAVENSGKPIQLLFILDGRFSGKSPQEKLLFKCNLPPAGKTYETEIIFKKVNSCTPLYSIPASGRMIIPGDKK